jgi:Mor family transcriptional regulator
VKNPDDYSFPISECNQDLSPELAQVAEIVGRENALRIAGIFGDKNLYIPQVINTGHRLAEILGLELARSLSREFGGIVLKIPTCRHLERKHRNDSIIRLYNAGHRVEELAAMFKLTERAVFLIISPQRGQMPHIKQLSLLGSDKTIFLKKRRKPKPK